VEVTRTRICSSS